MMKRPIRNKHIPGSEQVRDAITNYQSRQQELREAQENLDEARFSLVKRLVDSMTPEEMVARGIFTVNIRKVLKHFG